MVMVTGEVFTYICHIASGMVLFTVCILCTLILIVILKFHRPFITNKKNYILLINVSITPTVCPVGPATFASSTLNAPYLSLGTIKSFAKGDENNSTIPPLQTAARTPLDESSIRLWFAPWTARQPTASNPLYFLGKWVSKPCLLCHIDIFLLHRHTLSNEAMLLTSKWIGRLHPTCFMC